MECYSAGHGHVIVIDHHVPVHLFIDKPEYDGFVADKSLVVAFDVGYGLFIGATVGQFPEYGCRVPVLVFLFFQCLDPVVGDSHCHAVVEANASVFEWNGESGHAAHLLGNRYGLRIYAVDQQVGEREICDCINILIAVIIIAIAAEVLSESVVVVEHGGDAIEAESVEPVFLEPVFAVGEQEVDHLIFAVVEAQGDPGRRRPSPWKYWL